MSIRHAVVGTTLGDLTLVASGDALAGVYFPHHWTRPDRTALGDEVPADGELAGVAPLAYVGAEGCFLVVGGRRRDQVGQDQVLYAGPLRHGAERDRVGVVAEDRLERLACRRDG